MNRKAWVLIGLGVLTWCAAAMGQGASRPNATSAPATSTRPADDGMITVNFPENLDVKALMDYVNKRLGMKIICDASLANRRVTVISQARIPKDSVLSLIQSVLKVSGLALIDADEPGWKQVVPTTDLMAVSRGVPSDPSALADAQATAVVTQTFVPKYVPLSVIEGAIRPFLSKPGGNMFVVPDRNMLFVTDFAPNVRRAAALIPVLDQPGQKSKLRFVPIKNRLAATVATQVTALLQKRQAASGRGDARAGQGVTVTDEPGTNQIVIISPDGEDSEAVKLIEMFDVPANTQMHTYYFEHVSPVRVDALMKKFLETSISGKTYHSVIDVESGMMVVEASPDAHAQVAALKKQLDVGLTTTTVTYRFQYVDPRRIDRLVRDMMPAAVEGKGYKATLDPESGLYIVTAPAPVHEQIVSLRKELDLPETGQELNSVQFYKLMNAKASEVMATIRGIDSGDEGVSSQLQRDTAGVDIPMDRPLRSEIPPLRPVEGQPAPMAPYGPASRPAGLAGLGNFGGGGSYGTAGGYTGGSPFGGQGAAKRDGRMTARTRDASITADPNTNTIIVVASASVQKTYKRLIAILDRRRPQVMVEVTLMTLDTANNFSLGVDIAKAGSGDDFKYLVFSSFGVSKADADTGRLALSPGVGFNGALLSSNVADFVLRALATNGHTKVLSSPKILVNDNATATLSSVAEAPFTSVNASSTVSTTSFGGYAQAGTTLSIVPHISEGDHISLEYTITLNSFTGEGGNGVPPPRQTNTLDSQVTVPDGHTIVVGGMTRKDQSKTVTKIPFWGDIPYLGWFPGSHTSTDSQSTLFAFIRPIILRDDQFEDLKYMSTQEVARAGLTPDLPASDPLLVK